MRLASPCENVLDVDPADKMDSLPSGLVTFEHTGWTTLDVVGPAIPRPFGYGDGYARPQYHARISVFRVAAQQQELTEGRRFLPVTFCAVSNVLLQKQLQSGPRSSIG